MQVAYCIRFDGVPSSGHFLPRESRGRIARNVVDGNAGLGFGDNLGYWYCSVQLGKGFRFFDLGLRRSDCFCITDPDLQQGYSRGGEAEIR